MDETHLKQPKISVLMSVYKEPLEWISEAIESILKQTFPNFEFIIVNDNPESKQLKSFLDSYSKKDKRIKIITNCQNIGLTKSLNIGLKQCKGEFIARMDADDISMPIRFEKQIAFMEINNDLIASGAMAYAWKNNKIISKMDRPINYFEILPYTFNSTPFIHSLLFIRTALLNEYGIKYDERFRRSQDHKLAVDLLKFGKIANCKEYLLYYRCSNQQISNKYLNEQLEASKLIRRIYIQVYYNMYNFGKLDTELTLGSIKNNRLLERQFIKNGGIPQVKMHEFKNSMSAIRRLMYYSLSKYSVKSLSNFIFSKDSYRYPYNIRRFVVIILKHFKSDIIPKLI